MRSLNFISVVSFIIGATNAFASPANTSFHNSIKSESGSTGLTNTNSSATTSIQNSVDIQSGSRFSNIEIRMGYDRTKNDYSRYLLADRNGNSTVLSKTFDAAESTARFGASFYLKQTSFSLDTSKTFNSTPFPGSSAAVGVSQEVLETGTKIQSSFSRSEHQSPESFFNDPISFAPKRRPTRNLENKLNLGLEQIISDNSKLKFSVFGVDKPGTRPKQIGAEGGYAKAFSDNTALISKIGIAREKTNDELYDERGFFSANWVQIEFRYQPTYRWDLSVKLGTLLETESARGRFAQHKVGTDSLGFNAVTRFNFGELGFHALGVRSNTGYQSQTFGGNFTWNL